MIKSWYCSENIERKKDYPHVLFCTKCGKKCFGKEIKPAEPAPPPAEEEV